MIPNPTRDANTPTLVYYLDGTTLLTCTVRGVERVFDEEMNFQYIFYLSYVEAKSIRQKETVLSEAEMRSHCYLDHAEAVKAMIKASHDLREKTALKHKREMLIIQHDLHEQLKNLPGCSIEPVNEAFLAHTPWGYVVETVQGHSQLQPVLFFTEEEAKSVLLDCLTRGNPMYSPFHL